MVRINFYLQSIIIGVAIILIIAVVIDYENFFIWFAYYQMLIGFIQVLAALIFFCFPSLRTIHLKTHAILTILFFLVLAYTPFQIKWLLFTFPWVLALYFWYISFRIFKKSIS